MTLSKVQCELECDAEFLKKCTVLYVDDDKETRLQVDRYISRFAGAVISSEGSHQGLNVFRRIKPDIVVTDIQMPGMDGLKMAKIMLAENPQVKIIVLTAYEQSEYLKTAIVLGIDAFVTKPIAVSELHEALMASAHKLRKAKLQSDKMKLIEAEFERFSNLIDDSKVCVWQWDLLTGEVSFTKIWSDLLGYEPDELKNTGMKYWCDFIHEVDLNLTSDLVDNVVNGEAEFFEHVVRIKHKKGELIDAIIRGKLTTPASDSRAVMMHGILITTL